MSKLNFQFWGAAQIPMSFKLCSCKGRVTLLWAKSKDWLPHLWFLFVCLSHQRWGFILQSLVLSVTMIDFFPATNFHTFGAKSCSVTMINFGALFPGCNWFWWKLVTMIDFGALFLSPGKPGHQLSQFWRKISLSRQSWFYGSSFSFSLSPLEICA